MKREPPEEEVEVAEDVPLDLSTKELLKN